jgi:erythronate-4-phosphate dehydrogenase
VHLSHSLKISLAGKVIGIIGVGNVGSRVASVAKALGMRCLLNDPPLQRSGRGCLYSSLDEVLRTSDVITMHVPLTLSGLYATVGMANDEFFKKMKPDAIFINSSRGRVISEDALIIHRKKLSGVVLDVWKGEPEIDLHTVALANIATPHIAGHSFDGKVNGTRAVYEGACEFLGCEKKWDSIIGDSVFERKIIDVRDSPDPVFTAVQSAYPIMADDAALRNSLLKEGRGKCFENMRTKYDKRYEFKHFSVIFSKEQSVAALTLKGLGFICQ